MYLLLDISLAALLVTDLWILLYTKVLVFLNRLYPAKINTSFLWVQSEPEPFEISLYLVLMALFILTIFLFSKYKPRFSSLPTHIKIFFVSVLALVFIFFIGTYPMAREFDPYPPRSNHTIYILTIFLYLIATFLVMSMSHLLALLEKLKNKKMLTFVFIFAVLLVVTFDAGFPMAGHDYEYFLGPSFEVAMGKTVYTDVLSRYGFLTIDFLGMLQKLNMSLFYLPLIVWLLYVFQYAAIFYLIKKVGKSTLFATLGLVSVVTLNYFSLSHLPSVIPQTGPLRWFPMIILLLLLSKTKKLNSIFFMAVLSLLSLFMVDVGVAMICAYLASIGILLLIGQINLISFLKSILKFMIIFLLALLIVNTFHLVLGYQFVDIISIMYSFQKHAVLGLSLIPMATRTYFWFVPLIYFASIIYFFTKHIKHADHVGDTKGGDPASAQIRRYSPPVEHLREGISGQNLHDIILLFSANLSLFASIYFVGRSHPHNLFHISIFPLLTVFIFIGIFFSQVKSVKIKLLLVICLFITFVVFPSYERSYTLTEMILTKVDRLRSGRIFRSEVKEIVNKRYSDEFSLIKKHIKEDEIIILSVDDSYLFYAIKKKNLLAANPIMGIDLPEDLNFAVKKAVILCPKRIAIDCSVVGKCPSYTPFIGVSFNLNLILDELEKGCGAKYVPIVCTRQLCIAER